MDPGPIIASGRDGDIFEFGPGLVLRKTRDGRSIEHEARIIEYAEQHGFPVPHVEEVRAHGTEIVMERLEGPMLLDSLTREPTKVFERMRDLADLHDQLHAISAPGWLRRLDGGGKLLHLDLHPLNVMMTTRGPVVVDWGNAAAGDPLSDVALTYLMMTCPDVPVARPLQLALQPFRQLLANAFAKRYRGRDFDEHVALMAEVKQLDFNMAPHEQAKLARVGARIKRRLAKAPG